MARIHKVEIFNEKKQNEKKILKKHKQKNRKQKTI